MKRKHHLNISTASLRSSSSRRSRRSSTTNNHANSSTQPNRKRELNIKNTIEKGRIIGKASKKSFHCIGCNNIFNIYSSTTAFLNQHVKSNDQCPSAYPKCVACGKLFYEEKNLISHQTRSKKNLHVIQHIKKIN